ncbi:hypothetical protein LDG_6375 [Legionella drancourtii LLAP12]|uniref:Uncharacterized protein n=1 Tax=Legionella drancourtii LLAP12 TaxID=658187 RepID=G9EMB1_9GAMM|nr:hypothetical protein LDG_6375 [Legionella drancourtii LLAP12]
MHKNIPLSHFLLRFILKLVFTVNNFSHFKVRKVLKYWG